MKRFQNSIAFLAPDEVQEWLVIFLEFKVWLTLCLFECIHHFSVSKIVVPRLEHSATHCQLLNVVVGVLATLLCKLLQVIANIGNSNVEVPRILSVLLILVCFPVQLFHVLSDWVLLQFSVVGLRIHNSGCVSNAYTSQIRRTF